MTLKKILQCRRSIIAIFSIGCLTYLGVAQGTDVSMAIAGIVAAVCAGNSYENVGKAKHTGKVDDVG